MRIAKHLEGGIRRAVTEALLTVLGDLRHDWLSLIAFVRQGRLAAIHLWLQVVRLLFLSSVDLHGGLDGLLVSWLRNEWHVIFFVFIIHRLDSLSSWLLQITHGEHFCVKGLVFLGSFAGITFIISEGIELEGAILPSSGLV